MPSAPSGQLVELNCLAADLSNSLAQGLYDLRFLAFFTEQKMTRYSLGGLVSQMMTKSPSDHY